MHVSDVFTVDNSSAEARLKLVKQFLAFCNDQSSKRNTEQISALLEKFAEYMKNPPPNFNKSEIMNLRQHLKSHKSLSVYGFNSSRYDMQIIFDLLVKALDQPGFDRKNVSLLKKGTAYFSCEFGDLHFKDLLNFTCPQSLDQYLKTWTADCIKLVYPYEKFESIEEIRAQIEFPPIEDFKTTLKPNVDSEIYDQCSQEQGLNFVKLSQQKFC